MQAEVAAIVVAAGESRRMGVPKMALPWGSRTVIGQVIHVLQEAELTEIIVVTGGAETEVKQALQLQTVCTVRNEQYASGEMLSSVQRGLIGAMEGSAQAAMIVLGDQPQVQLKVVLGLLQRWKEAGSRILIPSYQMRRGHPWLIGRSLWQEVLDLQPPSTLRSFLETRRESIDYLNVQTDSILSDLDTPADYEHQRPVEDG